MPVGKPTILNRQVLSNSLGNTLEWYDFTIYGTLATVLAQLFFPTNNALVSLMLTFGAFAAGFIMRPLGGIIYGHIGDRFGRRVALIWSVLLMTIPTFLLGVLPPFSSIGVWAPLLVTLLRIAQGFAVGGEFTGSMTFLVETAPSNRRGLFGSYALVGVLTGILLGAAVVTITTSLTSRATLLLWGWRIPFLLGGVLGLCVWLVRRTIAETPVFKAAIAKEHDRPFPLIPCFQFHWRKVLRAFLITVFNAFAFYILMVYTTSYFHRIIGYSLQKSVALNLFMVALTLVFTPFAGLLSDFIGRKWVLGISAVGFMVLAYPIDLFFLSIPPLPLFLLAQALTCLLLAMYLGPLATTLAEIMPTTVRYTGLSVAYNLALALFGGTAPLLVTYFIAQTHVVTIPGIVLAISALVSLVVIVSGKETSRSPLA